MAGTRPLAASGPPLRFSRVPEDMNPSPWRCRSLLREPCVLRHRNHHSREVGEWSLNRHTCEVTQFSPDTPDRISVFPRKLPGPFWLQFLWNLTGLWEPSSEFIFTL